MRHSHMQVWRHGGGSCCHFEFSKTAAKFRTTSLIFAEDDDGATISSFGQWASKFAERQ